MTGNAGGESRLGAGRRRQQTMRMAVTGSTGLIGTEIVSYFTSQGHEVSRIVRPGTRVNDALPRIHWDVDRQEIEAGKLEGLDIVIHLAGAGLAAAQWTPHYKDVIRESRARGTVLISDTVASLQRPPKVFFSASAVGYYGSADYDEVVDETHPMGSGFLPEVCDLWEKGTESARVRGLRTVIMRFGAVLSRRGGLLARILPLFRLGLGGKAGSGKQPMSWITLAEIPCIIEFILANEHISGPVNCVAPECVTNGEFAKILGGMLHRPALFAVPAFVVESVCGEEMAREMVLNGARVVPRYLKDSGYAFLGPAIRVGLAKALYG